MTKLKMKSNEQLGDKAAKLWEAAITKGWQGFDYTTGEPISSVKGDRVLRRIQRIVSKMQYKPRLPEKEVSENE